MLVVYMRGSVRTIHLPTRQFQAPQVSHVAGPLTILENRYIPSPPTKKNWLYQRCKICVEYVRGLLVISEFAWLRRSEVGLML